MLREYLSNVALGGEVPLLGFPEPGFNLCDLPCLTVKKSLNRRHCQRVARNIKLAREVVEPLGLLIGDLDFKRDHLRAFAMNWFGVALARTPVKAPRI
jgi:hypothetical protein